MSSSIVLKLNSILQCMLRQNAMPSPSTIPRSSSDPNLTCPKTKTQVPGSSCSTKTGRSSKFSYWTHWSNINKLGNYIIPGRRSSSDSSKHSDLTEESLEAHKRLHGVLPTNARIKNYIIDGVDVKNARCSPYYKGLTDSTLILNRERNLSPGRESHAPTVATSFSSSRSSFILRMQEWSSCFTFKSDNKHIKNDHGNCIPNRSNVTFSASPASSSVWSKATSVKEATRLESKEASDSDVEKEKPLRERVPEPPSSILHSPAPKVLSLSEDTLVNDEQHAVVDRKNQRFIWADKYRPKALKDFICNRGEALRLQAQVKVGECGDHFIFEGPPGVGKRTMIWAMLREAYGPDRVQTREECKAFALKGEAVGSIQVNIKESTQHVEVNLSDLKGYEKHVIVELMKETQSRITNKALQSNPENCRAILLCEADKLSTDALLYIRWLLERYKGGNKVFFCCTDVSKLQPIKSLCTVIQLSMPSKEEIVEVLEFIAEKEGIDMPHQLAEKIADNSKNNLRQAIRSFEASWQASYPFKENQVMLTGWEDDIANIAKNIIEERSPKQLYIIRGKLQNLIQHDVSPDFIFESLVEELKKHLSQELQNQVDDLYKEYNRGDGSRFEEEQSGKKLNDPVKKNIQQFLKIEEFIAKFMSWYNYQQSRMAKTSKTGLHVGEPSC